MHLFKSLAIAQSVRVVCIRWLFSQWLVRSKLRINCCLVWCTRCIVSRLYYISADHDLSVCKIVDWKLRLKWCNDWVVLTDTLIRTIKSVSSRRDDLEFTGLLSGHLVKNVYLTLQTYHAFHFVRVSDYFRVSMWVMFEMICSRVMGMIWFNVKSLMF